jgi:hypothetical protein
MDTFAACKAYLLSLRLRGVANQLEYDAMMAVWVGVKLKLKQCSYCNQPALCRYHGRAVWRNMGWQCVVCFAGAYLSTDTDIVARKNGQWTP